MHYIYFILTIFSISYVLLHVSMHLHLFLGVLSFSLLNLQKSLRLLTVKSVDYSVYVIVIAYDKVQSVERCELCLLL
jgi:hypothetical protein